MIHRIFNFNTWIIVLSLFIYAGSARAQPNATYDWVWMKGNNILNQPGVYGVQGVPAPTNNPGARLVAYYWDAGKGNFYVFGGLGYGSNGTTPGALNDLWKYSVTSNEWVFLKGSSLINQQPQYGTMGVANAGNDPGGRYDPMQWMDGKGNLYLFGGALGSSGNSRSDLWKYDPVTNEWTWIKGSNLTNQRSVYGTQGVPNAANMPGGRFASACWWDKQGNFWLYGGTGIGWNPAGNFYMRAELSDLWRYNPATNEWTWMKGDTVILEPVNRGTLGVAAASNTPGCRTQPIFWQDGTGGSFYLYGGIDFGAGTREYGDMWRYDVATNNWTWINGSAALAAPSVWGTMGVSAATNTPGARSITTGTWKDTKGDLWMYGGRLAGGKVSADLWRYQIATNEWTWIKGASGATLGVPGVYGTQGVANPNDNPGTREGMCAWAIGDEFWLMGGSLNGSSNKGNNDLWKLMLNCPDSLTHLEGRLGSDTTICLGDALILHSPFPKAGNTWSDGSTDSVLNVSASGKYTLTVEQHGCIGSDTITINTRTPEVDLGKDTTICAGGSITLQSTGAYTNPDYLWSTGATTASITVNTPGLYRLIVTDEGCTSRDSINLKILEVVVDLGPDTVVCDGKAVVLQSSLDYTGNTDYNWNTGAATPSVTADQSGTYWLTVTQNGCNGSDTASVTIADPFKVNLGNDTALCNDDVVTLKTNPALANASYLWSTGARTSTLPVNNSGHYWLQATDNYGCSQSDSVTVTYVNLAQDLGSDKLLCREEPVDMDLKANVPQGAEVLWSTGATTPGIHIADSGQYWVMVSYFPCYGSDTIHINTHQCDCQVYMPNAFSPNGDGLNDLFRPVLDPGCPVLEYSFRVFNRWGQQVYSSAKPGEGWDGSILGKKAEIGTYMYFVSYTIELTNEKKILKGDVVLIR